jgi:hypothetical protein
MGEGGGGGGDHIQSHSHDVRQVESTGTTNGRGWGGGGTQEQGSGCSPELPTHPLDLRVAPVPTGVPEPSQHKELEVKGLHRALGAARGTGRRVKQGVHADK